MATAESKICVDLGAQELQLRIAQDVVFRCPVSTASNGAGERNGSLCTPRGRHQIHAKIGAGCEPNTVFVGRKPTGEIYTSELGRTNPGRDWILTRILWLDGKEPGKNAGEDVDTLERYIYLHGCPDEVDIARPGSHGCIRLRNQDIVELFERVETGTEVIIHE